MKLPVIEFKFKYNGVNTKMMVALEDVLFIDEYHLHLRDDARSFELVEGEYERLREVLISSISKEAILEECERRNKMARINSEIEQEK